MKSLLLLGLLGCSHPTAPVAPAAVGPGIATLQWYVGDWTCRGTDQHGNLSPDYPQLEIKVAPAFANWIAVDVWEHGKRTTGEFLGTDAKGVFHHIWTDEDGGNGSLTSGGWEGDTLVLATDHPEDKPVKSRMLLKRGDKDHYTHVYEEDNGTGFEPVFTKTCHRS